MVFAIYCGRSSGVERNLAKVEVEGSNPFARSKSQPYLHFLKIVSMYFNVLYCYKKMLVSNKYFVPCLIGPPIIFGLINSSFLIGLLILFIGFALTLIFLRLLNIIAGKEISSRYLGPRMNMLVMVAMYYWVGTYIPNFF